MSGQDSASYLCNTDAVTFEPAPFYCEENVWQLCGQPKFQGKPAVAIFISNCDKRVAMTQQLAGDAETGLVIWDYHVVFVAKSESEWRVWDYASRLGVAIELSIYLSATLGYPAGFPVPFDARFRVIEAGLYRQELCTDRSHMQDAEGIYRKPVPAWPAIGQGSNLMRLADTGNDVLGVVSSLGNLAQTLSNLAKSD